MAIGSKWAGKGIPNCGICQRQIQRSFVDGVTAGGRWGIMCPTCRINEGRMTLGVGLGQKYDRVGDSYVRTA